MNQQFKNIKNLLDQHIMIRFQFDHEFMDFRQMFSENAVEITENFNSYTTAIHEFIPQKNAINRIIKFVNDPNWIVSFC